MTTITVYKNQDGLLCGYEMSGHANGRRSGEYDLLCSALSALAYTGVNALEAVAGLVPDAQDGDGYLRCSIPAGQETSETVQTVLQTVLTGLTEIANDHPKHVRINNKERRKDHA